MTVVGNIFFCSLTKELHCCAETTCVFNLPTNRQPGNKCQRDLELERNHFAAGRAPEYSQEKE